VHSLTTCNCISWLHLCIYFLCLMYLFPVPYVILWFLYQLSSCSTSFASATEMMPCLHNYITVDTPAFLANPKNLEIIYNMCKKVITFEFVLRVILDNCSTFCCLVWYCWKKCHSSPKKSIQMYTAGYLLFIEFKERLLQFICALWRFVEW